MCGVVWCGVVYCGACVKGVCVVCVTCMCYPFVNPINLCILNVVVYESACRHLLYQKPFLLRRVLL